MMDGTIEKDEIIGLVVENGVPCKWSVQCEINHDGVVLTKQIPQAAELALELMAGLGQIADTWRDDHRGSACACGRKAESELMENILCTIGYLSDESIEKIVEACEERDA